MQTQPSSLEVGFQRLLVQCKDGLVRTMNEIDQPGMVNEPLGMVTHAWDRTTDQGQVATSEFITDTGMLVRGDDIVHEQGTSTTVNLPMQVADPGAILAAVEAAPKPGRIRSRGLSDRRRGFLVDNAAEVADDLNRVFRRVLFEYWVGWYSAEGIAYGVDGVYELDFVNESNQEMAELLLEDHRNLLVDQTQLAADQADVVLAVLPSTVHVKIDVFADGERIL